MTAIDCRQGVTGVILAGGQSRRMGGVDKSLCLLRGRPLLQWLVDLASPQVQQLVINAPVSEQLAAFNLPLVPDLHPGYRGPLMGLYSAMAWCAGRSVGNASHKANNACQWLAVFACDTPFLPGDLVARLRAAAEAKAVPIAVAVTDGQVQPTASLWRTNLLPELARAINGEKLAGFQQFLRGRRWARVDWTGDQAQRFASINSPEDLARAEACLDQGEMVAMTQAEKSGRC